MYTGKSCSGGVAQWPLKSTPGTEDPGSNPGHKLLRKKERNAVMKNLSHSYYLCVLLRRIVF
jgi:hypothetical protein